MADEPTLPPGIRLAADQNSPPITDARAIDAHTAHFHQPELLGIACQIQHPVKSGKPKAEHLGMLGAGIVLTPDGPIIMLQMQHPDGTSLGAILQGEDYNAFAEIYIPLGPQANLLATKSQGKG